MYYMCMYVHVVNKLHAQSAFSLSPSLQSLRADREKEQAEYEAHIGAMEEDHTAELQDIGGCICLHVHVHLNL